MVDLSKSRKKAKDAIPSRPQNKPTLAQDSYLVKFTTFEWRGLSELLSVLWCIDQKPLRNRNTPTLTRFMLYIDLGGQEWNDTRVANSGNVA